MNFQSADAGPSLMASGNLMAGRRGLIMGVANGHSIAWGIARALHAQGAELAFTYQGEPFEKRVRPLTEQLGAKLVFDCDVEDSGSLERVFDRLAAAWTKLDFVVHAIAHSDKNELKGRYVNTTRENFIRTMVISCYSFTEVARRAKALMPDGGALLTLTYLGADRVMPNYNVMGVAKAALESSMRYLAVDLGRDRIRVNAISAGPMRTLAGSAVGSARFVYNWNRQHSALRKNVDLEELGGAALYLLSPLSSGVSGEVHYVDGGYHIVGMPEPDVLNGGDAEG